MKNLPKIEDLVNGKELAQKQDQLNVLLNQNPPSAWIKTHSLISNYKYLPIDKVEYLLKRIFRNYKIEVLEHKMLMNAVSVHVRVHYQNPLTDEWSFYDGVGAEELQTRKGTGALQMDMSNINRGAMKMALPIAKTIAIKDACDHFGRIFGSDLGRKDLLEYTVNEKLKPELTEDNANFEKMQNAIKNGDITIEKLEETYFITNEIKEKLCSK